METNGNGILAYGYNLSSGEKGWQIEEADETGRWTPPWSHQDRPVQSLNELIDRDWNLAANAAQTLLASIGFTEFDRRADGFYERRRQAQEKIGVALTRYCSRSFSSWLLSAHAVIAVRGSVQTIDFPALDKLRVENGWDAKLTHAATALGITPKQNKPAWLLVSYWDD